MDTILNPNFYDRDPELVAQDLLGKVLVHNRNGIVLRGRIVETEAYLGPHDKAAHARFGQTERNKVLFGPAGHWYVYLIYGVYNLLNVTTGPEGSAVLIRVVEPVMGLDLKTDGPGKLTKAMGITRDYYGLSTSHSGLHILDVGEDIALEQIEAKPRVGISYAEEWMDVPLRFILKP